jgi:translation initiation factor IF-1
VAGTDPFKVEGLVMEVLSSKTYRVELANGHRLLAFATGRMAASPARFAAGDRVRLQLSPYDLSVGRIIEDRKI